jgi:hypothetical protein
MNELTIRAASDAFLTALQATCQRHNEWVKK